MRVFIQKVKGELSNLNFFQANKGFEELGYEIIYFSIEDLDILDFTKEDVFVGGIPVMDKVYKKLGLANPMFPTYPDELRPFCERRIVKNLMREVRNRICEEDGSVFIKPLDENRKLFTGHVVTKMRELVRTAHLPSSTEVWTSSVVEFETEYRCFINRGEIVGAKNYRGDFKKIINFNIVENAIALLKKPPIAYCLDFGLVRGRTVLVEANDSNAMGTYGLHPYLCARMIADRWNEVAGNERYP